MVSHVDPSPRITLTPSPSPCAQGEGSVAARQVAILELFSTSTFPLSLRTLTGGGTRVLPLIRRQLAPLPAHRERG